MKSKSVNLTNLIAKLERKINFNLKYLNELKSFQRASKIPLLKLNRFEGKKSFEIKNRILRLYQIQKAFSRKYLEWNEAKNIFDLVKYMEVDDDRDNHASYMDVSVNANETSKMDLGDS